MAHLQTRELAVRPSEPWGIGLVSLDAFPVFLSLRVLLLICIYLFGELLVELY